MPSLVDEVEKTTTKLKRLIDCYQSEKWGLVAVGITTTFVEIMKFFFVGSQIIVFDASIDRTRFLYNILEELRSSRTEARQNSRG